MLRAVLRALRAVRARSAPATAPPSPERLPQAGDDGWTMLRKAQANAPDLFAQARAAEAARLRILAEQAPPAPTGPALAEDAPSE